MASRYYGLNRGQKKTNIVEGSSTGSKTFEFAVNLADSSTRAEALMALREIEAYIVEDAWPPA